MIRVATYSTHGPFPSRVVELKQIQGPQRWRVIVTTQREDGQRDDIAVDASEPIPLGAMATMVMDAIKDACEDGPKLVRADMVFYIAAKANMKKARRAA